MESMPIVDPVGFIPPINAPLFLLGSIVPFWPAFAPASIILGIL